MFYVADICQLLVNIFILYFMRGALKTYECPILIKQKIKEERILRRSWHRLSKRLLNTAIQELKELINIKNDSIQTFLQGVTITETTDYSLRKTI
jgi:hypothetical protein